MLNNPHFRKNSWLRCQLRQIRPDTALPALQFAARLDMAGALATGNALRQLPEVSVSRA